MSSWPFSSNLAPGSQIAQVRPVVTTAVTAWVPTLRTEITSIKICNTSASARVFSVFHDDDGGTFSEATALYWGRTAGIGETISIDASSPYAGITVSKNGRIGVRSDLTSGLTFTFYGAVQMAGG